MMNKWCDILQLGRKNNTKPSLNRIRLYSKTNPKYVNRCLDIPSAFDQIVRNIII